MHKAEEDSKLEKAISFLSLSDKVEVGRNLSLVTSSKPEPLEKRRRRDLQGRVLDQDPPSPRCLKSGRRHPEVFGFRRSGVRGPVVKFELQQEKLVMVVDARHKFEFELMRPVGNFVFEPLGTSMKPLGASSECYREVKAIMLFMGRWLHAFN